MKNLDKLLNDALIKNNILSESDTHTHLQEASLAAKSFKEYLLEKNIVTERQILTALSESCRLSTFDLNQNKVEPSVIERVPVKFAWYYKFLPINVELNQLTIACALPMSIKMQDEIRMHLGLEVSVVLVQESQLTEAFKEYYGFASDTIDRMITKESIDTAETTSMHENKWVEDLEKTTEDPTVSDLVNQIILEAYRKRATDIHIEPYRDKVRFRYRIDGVLVDANLPDKVKHFIRPILSRIKILANLSITEKRLPQDGSAVVKTKEQDLDLRVSTLPTPRGESMVIRVLRSKVILYSLERLGFNAEDIAQFRDLIDKPHGIIFITGPTGSGKTTTLYACLNEINSTTRKIITIEDPVEYEMSSITQVQVNPKVNFNFATGLRSILRHDPDILMVGEVRDPETAEIAIKTALTGHLVFSTLHTNDASSGVTRLIDMGVEPYLVVSSVESFVAQRLVRVICPRCKEEAHESVDGFKKEIAKSLSLPKTQDIKIYKGRGCDYCNQTGYYGRVAIYEILMINDALRAAIIEKPRADHIKEMAIKQGMRTLRQNGWSAVINGVTTPEEVINVTVRDDEFEDLNKEEENEQASNVRAPSFEVSSKEKESQIKEDSESRKSLRHKCAIMIRYQRLKDTGDSKGAVTTEGIEHPAWAKDISAAGLSFISKQMIPLGTTLALKIQLNPAQRGLVCFGKVTRLEEDDTDQVYRLAIVFEGIAQRDADIINCFIEKQSRIRNS